MIIVVQPTTRRRRPRANVPNGPIGGLTDPRFVYVRSEATDIRKTFRRVSALQKKGALP